MTIDERFPLELAFDGLPDAAVVFSPDLHVQAANREAISLLGFRPGDRLHGPQGAWMLRVLLGISGRRGDLHGRRWEDTVRFAGGGEERTFLPDAVVMQNEARRVIALILVLRDVTDLRPANGRIEPSSTAQEESHS